MKCFCIYVRNPVKMHKSSKYKKQTLDYVQLSIYNVWECNGRKSIHTQILLILRAKVTQKVYNFSDIFFVINSSQ